MAIINMAQKGAIAIKFGSARRSAGGRRIYSAEVFLGYAAPYRAEVYRRGLAVARIAAIPKARKVAGGGASGAIGDIPLQ